MSPISVVYVLYHTYKALEFEWVAERLNRSRFALSFILLNDGNSELERFLGRIGIPCERVAYAGKRDFFRAFRAVYSRFRSNPPDIVHAHLLDAALIGLASARLAGVPVRIHTRHHSTYNHQYHPHAVAYDRLVNWLSTDIVAISGNVERVLREREGVDGRKIHLIHHGLELGHFLKAEPRKIAALRERYNPRGMSPVIGVISRYERWKGVQYIIPAFKALLAAYPDGLLVLANARKGDYEAEVAVLLAEIPQRNRIEIEFENDNASLYRLFDLFVHAPIDSHSEAFGQVYIEALAAGIPCVFTLSGIAADIIRDQHNAMVAEYRDSDSIHGAMLALLGDGKLRDRLAAQGRIDVVNGFTIQQKVRSLDTLYSDCRLRNGRGDVAAGNWRNP